MNTEDQAPETVAEKPTVETVEAAEAIVAEPVADEPAPEVQAVEETEQPAVETAAETAAEKISEDAEPVAEHVVDGLVGGDTLVPMVHPEGGSSDAYERTSDGELLVPATDVAVMASHGFTIVEAE